jgi:hypothetical protein
MDATVVPVAVTCSPLGLRVKIQQLLGSMGIKTTILPQIQVRSIFTKGAKTNPIGSEKYHLRSQKTIPLNCW